MHDMTEDMRYKTWGTFLENTFVQIKSINIPSKTMPKPRLAPIMYLILF